MGKGGRARGAREKRKRFPAPGERSARVLERTRARPSPARTARTARRGRTRPARARATRNCDAGEEPSRVAGNEREGAKGVARVDDESSRRERAADEHAMTRAGRRRPAGTLLFQRVHPRRFIGGASVRFGVPMSQRISSAVAVYRPRFAPEIRRDSGRPQIFCRQILWSTDRGLPKGSARPRAARTFSRTHRTMSTVVANTLVTTASARAAGATRTGAFPSAVPLGADARAEAKARRPSILHRQGPRAADAGRGSATAPAGTRASSLPRRAPSRPRRSPRAPKRVAPHPRPRPAPAPRPAFAERGLRSRLAAAPPR